MVTFFKFSGERMKRFENFLTRTMCARRLFLLWPSQTCFREAIRAGALFVSMATAMNTPALAEEHNPFTVTDVQMRALGVDLITLAVQSDTSGLRFPARVVLPPQAEHVVSAPIAGLINQVLAQENQTVKVGTPLLVLSSPDLGQMQLALVEAANRERLAQQTLAREQSLFKEGIIPQRRVEEAEAAERDASAALTQSRATLLLAGVGNAETDQIAKSGDVQSELTLVAKTGGIVTSLNIKPGQRVAVADPLLHLARIETLWLDVQIPSGEAARWAPGDKLHAADGVEAKVLNISPLASDAQTVLLRAQLASGAKHLRPGEFTQAELPLATGPAWEVPLSSIARESDQAYVFVRKGEQFTAVPVTVIATAGQRVKISGGLKSGDAIAVSSVIALKAAWQGLGGAEEE